MHLTFFDNVTIVISILSLALGIFKGFIKTLLDLMLFVVTICLTLWLLPYSYEVLHEHVYNSLAVNILGSIICYIFSVICISLLSKNVKLLISPISGGMIDRCFGGVLGLFRAFIISNILFMGIIIVSGGQAITHNSLTDLFTKNNLNNAKWLASSYSFKFFDSSSKDIISLLPNSIVAIKIEDFPIYKSIFGAAESEAETPDNNSIGVNFDEDLKKALKDVNSTMGTIEQ